MKTRGKIWISPVLALAAATLLVVGCGGNRGGGGSDAVRTSYGYNLPAGAEETVSQANDVVQDFFSRTGKDIPASVLDNAAGIAIIPNLTKAAFGVGLRHGSGVLLTRENNQWSLPVFASITGGSFGYQIGITTTDLLLVFQNREAVSKLRGGSYELGGDVTVAAGPVGGSAGISTGADVLTYKRTEGAFAGAALTGSRISLDSEKTAAYYGVEETARGYYSLLDDLMNPRQKADVRNVPRNASQLKQTLDRVAARSSSR